MLPRARLPRLTRPTRLTALIIVAVFALGTAGGAIAGGAMSLPTFVPRFADQVTNLDILRSQIKNYYGTPTAATGMTACNSATEYGRYIDSPRAVLSCTSDTCTLLS